MMTTINNWKPEVKSLLKSLTDAGFKVTYGNNGEYGFAFQTEAKFIEDLTACDEAHLKVTGPDGLTRWLFLVFGNSPGELVSDYSIPAALNGADPLDKVTEAHYEKWEGRRQPKLTGAYLKGKFVSVAKFKKAQLAFVAEVNAVIHTHNLFAHVGHDGQDRRVVNCHVDSKGEVVVCDLYDSAKTYIVNYTSFRDGSNNAVTFKSRV